MVLSGIKLGSGVFNVGYHTLTRAAEVLSPHPKKIARRGGGGGPDSSTQRYKLTRGPPELVRHFRL